MSHTRKRTAIAGDPKEGSPFARGRGTRNRKHAEHAEHGERKVSGEGSLAMISTRQERAERAQARQPKAGTVPNRQQLRLSAKLGSEQGALGASKSVEDRRVSRGDRRDCSRSAGRLELRRDGRCGPHTKPGLLG